MEKEEAVLFSLSATPDLAQAIAARLDIHLGQRSIRRFPSGEIIVEPNESVRGKVVYIVQSTCPPVNENLMELMIFVDALKRASAKEINVIIPYFGYARQDRKAKPRQPITASLVANLLVTAGVDRVMTVNLHAAQIQGFFSCLVDNLSAIKLLGYYIMKTHKDLSNICVVSPDHGGVERARNLAELFNAPLAIIDKRRNNNLEPEVMAIIGDVKGKDCFMIDDMIDTAKSAVNGARALKANGAKSVKIAAGHGVFSDPAAELLSTGIFDEIIVTDSIPLSDSMKKVKNVSVVSLAPMIADVIKRITSHKPLTSVYDAYANPENTDVEIVVKSTTK